MLRIIDTSSSSETRGRNCKEMYEDETNWGNNKEGQIIENEVRT